MGVGIPILVGILLPGLRRRVAGFYAGFELVPDMNTHSLLPTSQRSKLNGAEDPGVMGS
jgi:hypothetical protein